MQTNYTPGNWRIAQEIAQEGIWIESSGDEPEEICMVSTATVPREESAANARLLASAPDLLAALRALVNGRVRISDKANDMLSEHDPKVIAARSAIAKATS